jgi:phenylalanine-4-hydroxylase
VDGGIRIDGTVENPKIYGAGLLSSIAKVHCMTPEVTKIPYDISATQNFDITKLQPCMLRLHLRI